MSEARRGDREGRQAGPGVAILSRRARIHRRATAVPLRPVAASRCGDYLVPARARAFPHVWTTSGHPCKPHPRNCGHAGATNAQDGASRGPAEVMVSHRTVNFIHTERSSTMKRIVIALATLIGSAALPSRIPRPWTSAPASRKSRRRATSPRCRCPSGTRNWPPSRKHPATAAPARSAVMTDRRPRRLSSAAPVRSQETQPRAA